MAKVTDKHDSWAMGKRLDCGHVFFDFDTEEDTFSDLHSDPFQIGDEVDCPVCADNEKQVKAARVEVLKEVIIKYDADFTILPLTGKSDADSPDILAGRINKLIAELEAGDDT